MVNYTRAPTRRFSVVTSTRFNTSTQVVSVLSSLSLFHYLFIDTHTYIAGIFDTKFELAFSLWFSLLIHLDRILHMHRNYANPQRWIQISFLRWYIIGFSRYSRAHWFHFVVKTGFQKIFFTVNTHREKYNRNLYAGNKSYYGLISRKRRKGNDKNNIRQKYVDGVPTIAAKN